jgi:hypothetical protein
LTIGIVITARTYSNFVDVSIIGGGILAIFLVSIGEVLLHKSLAWPIDQPSDE